MVYRAGWSDQDGDGIRERDGSRLEFTLLSRVDRIAIMVQEQLRRHTLDEEASASLWTDAYLAAFAQAAGVSLATFDRGFSRFSGLRLQLLS